MILKITTAALLSVICYIAGSMICEVTNEPYLIGFIAGITFLAIYIIIDILLGDLYEER